jgi:hypothetical protein
MPKEGGFGKLKGKRDGQIAKADPFGQSGLRLVPSPGSWANVVDLPNVGIIATARASLAALAESLQGNFDGY